ncbi:MAG: hypothetical protein VX086_02435 [Pseudomonadota bacterium]|nr:hypothetical protein [Pseudomonadota bacterium]
MSSIIALLDNDLPSIKWLKRNNINYTVIKADEDTPWERHLVSKYTPDVWINDRMDTSVSHAQKIKNFGISLVTIDDIGKGAPYADLHISPFAQFRGMEPTKTRILTGMEYLVLPEEVAACRRLRESHDKWIVTLGGSDTYGVTITIIKWLIERAKKATVILGPAFGHNCNLANIDKKIITLKKTVPSLMQELAQHDFAITGGGMTAFESTAQGLPTAIIANEKWEVSHAEFLASKGCSIFLGTQNKPNLDLLNEKMNIKRMSEKALNLINVHGSEKIVQELLKLSRK